MSEDDEESDHVYDSEEDNWISANKGTYQLTVGSYDSFHPIAADNQDAGFRAVLRRKAKLYDVEAESFSMVDIQHIGRAESANTEQVMLLFGLHVSLQSLV